MHTTEVSRRIAAPASVVYRALLDPVAVAVWRVPDDMSFQVHEFDAREGGRFRVSLSYDAPDRSGKSAGNTDTYSGHFQRLVPDKQVVEVLGFETDDVALQPSMTMTTTLDEVDGITTVTIRHEGIPDAVSPADNETGTQMALDKLAAYVEAASA